MVIDENGDSVFAKSVGKFLIPFKMLCHAVGNLKHGFDRRGVLRKIACGVNVGKTRSGFKGEFFFYTSHKYSSVLTPRSEFIHTILPYIVIFFIIITIRNSLLLCTKNKGIFCKLTQERRKMHDKLIGGQK